MSMRNILDGTIKVAMGGGGGGSSSGSGGAQAFTYQHLNDITQVEWTNTNTNIKIENMAVERCLYHLMPNVHFLSIKVDVPDISTPITQMKITTGLDSELGLETLASTVVNADMFLDARVIIAEENKKIVCYLYFTKEYELSEAVTFKINLTIPIMSAIN